MEQIRIVKEMRDRDEHNGRADVDIRPRYMVWENVHGAFSSNKGDDFRIVLEEIAKVCDKDAVIPMPDKGKWTNHGCILGDGWSVAWRVLDAQFWGVPQRRRRIALVADFGGQSAPEILFVRKSLSGHTDEGKQKRQEAPSDASRGFGADDCIGVDIYNTALTGDKPCPLTAEGHTSTGTCPKVMTPITFEPVIAAREGGHIYEGVSGTLRANAGDNQMATAYTLKIRSGCEGGVKGALIQEDKSATLACNNDQYLFQPVFSVENHPHDSRVGINEDGIVQALTSRMGTGGGNVPMVMALFSKSQRGHSADDATTWKHSDKTNTLNTFDLGEARANELVVYAVDQGGGKSACNVTEGQTPTLTCTHGGEPAVCYRPYPQEIHDFVAENNADAPHQQDLLQTADGVARTLASGTHAAGSHLTKTIIRVGTRYIVRRLTPLECERLQGYPDGWTDIGEWTDSNGKKRQTSDAARYKALGNSIALPPWKWVLKRICACYERDATMASLFDGIGGFPYLWEQLNGKGTCLWASEIEEFPIAVTKVRIGGDT